MKLIKSILPFISAMAIVTTLQGENIVLPSGGMEFKIDTESKEVILLNIDEAVEAMKAAELTTLEVPGTVKDADGTEYAVTTVGYGLFQKISSLEKVILPASVKHFQGANFCECPDLKSVELGGNVEYIGGSSFNNLPQLSDFTLPESLLEIEDYSLNGIAITSLRLPAKLSRIGEGCFGSLHALESIDFSAVNACGLGAYSFAGLNSLKELDLGHAFWQIPFLSFYGMENVETITLPDLDNGPRVWIDETAFGKFPALKSVYCPHATPPNMTDNGRTHEFGGVTGAEESINKTTCTLYVPVGSAETYRNHPSWQAFAKIEEYDPASLNTVNAETSGEAISDHITIGNGVLTVFPSAPHAISIFSIDGKHYATVEARTGATLRPAHGIYILSANGQTLKIII